MDEAMKCHWGWCLLNSHRINVGNPYCRAPKVGRYALNRYLRLGERRRETWVCTATNVRAEAFWLATDYLVVSKMEKRGKGHLK